MKPGSVVCIFALGHHIRCISPINRGLKKKNSPRTPRQGFLYHDTAYVLDHVILYVCWGGAGTGGVHYTVFANIPGLHSLNTCRTSVSPQGVTDKNVSACLYAQLLSCVRLFETLWTVAHQASLSMGFSRQRILEWVAISSSRESS